jgi:glycosyltransferase involved in cell wall biosynthesis
VLGVRIAYLCCDFGIPVCGTKGASVHVRELSRALHDLGHEVVIVTPRAGGSAPPGFPVPIHELALDGFDEITCELLEGDPGAGIPVTSEIRAALYASVLRHRALEYLRAFGPDLIYERFSLFGTAGVALARCLRVPHLLEVNAPLSDEQARHRGLQFARTARQLERILLRSADHVIAVSPALAGWVVRAGVEPHRVSVLANGVDVERFEAADRERYLMRARLGLAGRRVVGFVGTLKPWHDTRTLVHAVGLLRRNGVETHLLVVGDGPERGRVEELVRAEGIAEATTFTGAVPHEHVPAYLAAVDVAAAPYRSSDNFYFSPLKLFEYLAAARPVVAADVGQIAHCVRPGRTGCLYRPGDVPGLARAIAALLRDPLHGAALGAAGREHVRACHSWEGNARCVLELARPALEVCLAS